ncbi:divergent protein kinase domain 1C [Hemiscyllium ocellatum]|uniref:divergent protein kinase domain 1C n=1 Tax=Hemiscyllium ocellatum TaxID=170820 RepID=UPI002965D165|nr:divergent protein kinase domain 1C [Hemiscyllium ocellatum]
MPAVIWAPSFRQFRAKLLRKPVFFCFLLWIGCWLLLNASIFIRRSLFAEYCTDQRSKGILRKLCQDYRQGILTGDLCEDLCVTQTMVYKRCLYYNKGKKVIQADWNGQPIILKSKLEDFLSYESLYLLDERESRPIPDVDILVFTALEIKHSLGLDVKNVTVPQLWTKHLKGKTGSFSRAELASMWSLFQQEEYVFFQLLQDLSKHVLRVIGSCGHFYAVEYLTAGHAWHRSLFSLEKLVPLSWRGSSRKAWWQVTNGIALSFLELARHFENDFSHQLHLCDIKPENFAIRADLTVVTIDVDMAFFEPKMRAILEQNCTDDEDCNFFDCFSRCNIKTKKCRADRSNNNLQVICDKIFRPLFSPRLSELRVYHPLQTQLYEAVQRCAELSDQGSVDKKTMEITFSELYNLFTACQRDM